MNKINALILVLLLSSISNADQSKYYTSEAQQMKEETANYKKMHIYKNISTAPSYVKFKIKDDLSSETFEVLLENPQLAEFLGGVRNDKKGRLSYPENFMSFIDNRYLDFMLRYEGGLREIRLSDFPINSALGVSHNEDDLRKFFNAYTYNGSMSFSELGVTNEKELITKFFDYNDNTNRGYLREEFSQKYNNNEAFLALLIDLGYQVSRMDIAPVLCISKFR